MACTYKVEKRSDWVEGHYYEPNKDYGGTEWIAGHYFKYWVIISSDGFVKDTKFYTYQKAYATLRALAKRNKR